MLLYASLYCTKRRDIMIKGKRNQRFTRNIKDWNYYACSLGMMVRRQTRLSNCSCMRCKIKIKKKNLRKVKVEETDAQRLARHREGLFCVIRPMRKDRTE